MYLIYQFEASAIQQYILASGKLREMVAASQLLEALTEDILETCLKAQGFSINQNQQPPQSPDQVILPRKAGGTFLAVFQASPKAQAFCQSWPLIVQQYMPGLNFSSAWQEGKDIPQLINQVREKLNQQKNIPQITLPEQTPISQINRRTGLAVTKRQGEEEFLDSVSEIKNKTHYQGADIFAKTTEKWQGEMFNNHTFPTVFEHKLSEAKENHFPFSGKDGEHYVAIIHADGNGMGQYIKDFMQEIGKDNSFLSEYARFSQALEETSKQAAQAATDWLIQHWQSNSNSNLPIRPLILSGDDITCIIRADYAFAFIKKLAQSFEQHSKMQLDKINNSKARKVFPEYLTLSAGMVFLRSNQPFYMAYQLAESLCEQAKNHARKAQQAEHPIPSTLSFHLISNSLFEDANTQIKQELTLPNGNKLTLECYAIGNNPPETLLTLDWLANISRHFDNKIFKISFIRQLTAIMHQDSDYAEKMLQRWQQLAQKEKEKSEKYAELNKTLGEQHKSANWLRQNTFLSDLICFNAMESYYE